MLNKIIPYVFIVIGICLMWTAAHATDTYLMEGRPRVCDMPSGPRLEACSAWISAVNRPDYRGARCCGDGDAYIVDNFRVDMKEGKLYAIISADYYSPNDGQLFLKKDTEIEIPADKVNTAPEDANRSGHGVLFLNNFTREVLCYFFPPLT